MDQLLDWDRRAWLRLLIVLGTLALTTLLARSPTPLVLAVGLGGVGALLALLRWPALGLGLLIVGTVLVPFGVNTGTQTRVNIAVILVAALSLQLIVEKLLTHDLRFLPSRTIRPLVALVIVSLLAFVNGLQHWMIFADLAPVRAQLGGLAIFVLSACAFTMFGHRVRDVQMLSRLTWTFLAVAAVCALERALLPFAALRTLYEVVANGSMFWLWMVILAFSQGAFNRKLAAPWRLALLGLVGLYMYFAIAKDSSWNSGWLPELIAIAVIACVGWGQIGFATALAGSTALLLKGADIANALLYHNQKNQFDLLTRTAAWEIVGKLIQLDPILGIGFANYYYYTALFPILGIYGINFNSHNNYVDILAQTGVIGMICFLWFFGELFWAAWSLRKRVAPGFGQAFVYGIIGAIPAVLSAAFLGDWLLPFVYNIGLVGFRASVLAWLFMGGLLVIEHQTAQAEVSKDAC